MVWIIIIILLSAADQLIKAVVRANIAPGESLPVIDGFLYIISRKNTGAAWSFLADKPWGIYVLASFSAVISVALIVIIFKTPSLKLKACLSFICGGSIGNLVDRVRDGSVTDYLDFHFGSYIFPTFNLADSCIVCGTIALGLLILLDPQMMSLLTLTGKKPAETEPAGEHQEGPADAHDHPD